MADYVTVREHLGRFIGRRIVEITQQDEEEFAETGEAYILLMFEDGSTLRFPVTEKVIYYAEFKS